MSESVYFLTICLPLATILLVFGMKYFAAIQQAKARLASDDAYRALAEKAIAMQSENQATLATVQAELSRLTASLATVEKILKQVE